VAADVGIRSPHDAGPHDAGPHDTGQHDTGQDERRGGRPRDPSRDAAIKAAVLHLLGAAGYNGLTMDAVAASAGVSKATIYRRWPSKTDLLIDLIDESSVAGLDVPDTGCLRGDLVALLQSLAEVLIGPGGRVSRALLGALEDEPELATAYRRGPLQRWAEAFDGVFARAVHRGEIPAVAATSLAAEAGSAILLQRWLVTGQLLDLTVVTGIVDEVVLPSLAARG
jgi:AcrR family transcriptional regulator